MSWADDYIDDLRSDGPLEPATVEWLRDGFECWVQSPGSKLHEHLGLDRRKIILRDRNPHLFAALSEYEGTFNQQCKQLAVTIKVFAQKVWPDADEIDPSWPNVYWHLWLAFQFDDLEKIPQTREGLRIALGKSEDVCIYTDEGQNSNHDNRRKTKVAR